MLLAAAALAMAPQAATQAIEPSDDVVVTGLRDLDDPESLVTRRSLGSARTGASARTSRATFALSERYARCAITDAPPILRILGQAIDGNINSARQRFAQAQLARIRSSCAQDAEVARLTGVATIDPRYDTSYYDRGALVIAALRRFAPDLQLTTRETRDPRVQQRFDAREIARARFRLPVDRSYFEYAVCFVREQPELSARLATQPLSDDAVARLEAAIVNRGRVCAGGARQVYFDPSQFRFYIADAVYRWAVAARGVDTLLPSR